jgi:hypothetical protein
LGTGGLTFGCSAPPSGGIGSGNSGFCSDTVSS